MFRCDFIQNVQNRNQTIMKSQYLLNFQSSERSTRTLELYKVDDLYVHKIPKDMKFGLLINIQYSNYGRYLFVH